MSTKVNEKIEARRVQSAEMVTRLMGEYDDGKIATETGRSCWINSVNPATGVTASTLVTVLVLPSGNIAVGVNSAWTRTNAEGRTLTEGVFPREDMIVSTYEEVEATVFAHTDALRGLMGLDIKGKPQG